MNEKPTLGPSLITCPRAARFRRQMSGDRRQKLLRRFAPEVYVSGFRVEPAMTTHFFASPGVGFGIARQGL
ncbi:MAG: hypothetical protein LBS70_10415 [Candidatus Accumulibacter sp.]|jgi:hypothetical protein|nr:hypothetical protein [Accumulibacter sp.]